MPSGGWRTPIGQGMSGSSAKLEAQMTATDKTMLLIYPSMLARYDDMGLLERLQDKVGRPDGIHGVWLLIPGDQHAMMNGRAVPISPGQRARIPESWLKNVHRANGHTVAAP